MGERALTPSQRITAKAELERTAKALAETVEAYYQSHTCAAQDRMFAALADYRRAESAL